MFILALGGEKYATELAALAGWVNYLFLPVYGREISTTRPWCDQWHEHPEAVARLHALWLAWQQLTDAEAGLSGPSTWHRDHLDQALVHLRAPDGPFAACTTSPTRPNHRVLATPAPVPGGRCPVTTELDFRLDDLEPADPVSELAESGLWAGDLTVLAEHHTPDGSHSYVVAHDGSVTWGVPGSPQLVAITIARDLDRAHVHLRDRDTTPVCPSRKPG